MNMHCEDYGILLLAWNRLYYRTVCAYVINCMFVTSVWCLFFYFFTGVDDVWGSKFSQNLGGGSV